MIEKPTTIAAAVDTLVSLFSKEDTEYIRKTPHPPYHFFSGRLIRNAWELWIPESPLRVEAAKTYQINHADDVSGLLFEWAFAKIRGQDFDPHEHVKRYHEHWSKINAR